MGLEKGLELAPWLGPLSGTAIAAEIEVVVGTQIPAGFETQDSGGVTGTKIEVEIKSAEKGRDWN